MHRAGGSTVSLSPLQTLVSAILLIGALDIIKITLLSQRFIQNINLAAAGGAVLGVLLVLRVEVVDGVRHDVARVDRLPGKYLSSLKNIWYLVPHLSEEEMLCMVTLLPTLSPAPAPAPHWPMYTANVACYKHHVSNECSVPPDTGKA